LYRADYPIQFRDQKNSSNPYSTGKYYDPLAINRFEET